MIKTKKSIVTILLIFVIMTILPISAFAMTRTEAENEWDRYANLDSSSGCLTQDSFNALKQALRDANDTYGGIMASAFNSVATSSGINPEKSIINEDTIENFLITQLKTNGGYGGGGGLSLFECLSSAYVVLESAGIALMTMYFIIELLNDVQMSSFTLEMFVRRLLMLAIALIVMLNGIKIFYAVAKFGDALATEVMGAMQMATSTSAIGEAKEAWVSLMTLNEDGFWVGLKVFFVALGYIMENIFPNLIISVAKLFIQVIAYSRFIELGLRFVFAPIGCAGLAEGSQGPAHSQGMRYIKKFASCGLQSAVIVGAFFMTRIVQNIFQDSATASILVPLALIGFVFRAKSVADEIVGV